MKIKTMPLGALGTNCYIIYKDNEALIIDPGDEASKVINFIEENDLKPMAILLTHAHFDHIGAVDEVRNFFEIDVYLHENEAEWLEEPHFNGSALYPRQEVKTTKPDHYLKPGNMTLGGFSFEIRHTPGHSPGSVSFLFHEEQVIFSGDVLFRQGVGRTDLLQGNAAQLANSIQRKLYTLDDQFIVFPGHGISTTIGEEKRSNPYVSATN